MSCCGQRRAAMRNAGRRPAPVAPVPASVHHPTALRYLGAGPFVIRGAVTGLLYGFPADAPLLVDAADVPALLADGRFAAETAPKPRTTRTATPPP